MLIKIYKERRYRFYLLIAAAFAFLILLLTSFWTRNQLTELTEHRRAVIQMHEFLAQLERLQSSLSQAESAQRGFVITGDSSYKKSFEIEKSTAMKLLTLFEKPDVGDGDSPTSANLIAELCDRIEYYFHVLEVDMEKAEETVVSKKRKRLTRIENTRSTTEKKIRLSGDSASPNTEDLEGLDLEIEVSGKEMNLVKMTLHRIRSREQINLDTKAKALEKAVLDSQVKITGLSAISLVIFLCAFIYMEKAETALSDNYARQRLFYRVSQALAAETPLETSVQEVLELFCKHFNWKVGAFWRHYDENNSLKCSVFVSMISVPNFETITKQLEITRDSGTLGSAWQKKIPLWYRDVRTVENFIRVKESDADGLKFSICLPLFLADELVGIFEFFDNKTLDYDDELYEAFSSVCGELAQFIRRKEIEETLKKSLVELEKSQRIMDLVIRNMGSGVVVSDSDGNFITFNDAAREILGIGALDISMENWSKEYGIYENENGTLIPPEELPISRALRGESTDNVVLYCKNSARPYGVWISINGRPMINRAGNIIGGVVVMENISTRKESERRVSEFYSMVSHELRTPLTSIRGAIGLIMGGKAGELSSRATHLMGIALNESERLIRLINDILDVRKIEAGKVELKIEKILPSYLVHKVVDSLKSYAQELNVEIEIGTICDEEVCGDLDRLCQVLTNLISNAIKFSPPGNKVTVSAIDVENQIRFDVIDLGPGIPAHEQRKLFKVFQQLNSSDNRPKGGSGLGLSICKSLVELHGGSIGLESNEGQGSRFWFLLDKAEVD